MPQINPRWLITQAPGDLKGQIQKAISYGYHVTSQTATTAQLVRQKSFSCLLATVLFFFLAIPFFIYLFYYLAKKDDAIYLDIETQPKGEELKKEVEEYNNRPWYKKHPVATGLLVMMGAGLVLTTFVSRFSDGVSGTNQSENREIKQVFDVPSLVGKSLDEIKRTMGAPVEVTQPTKLQLQHGTAGEEYIAWEKDGIRLTVFYEYKTKKINDFFVRPSSAGGTRDKALLLGSGGLKEDDPRYTVKFVEAVTRPPSPGLYAGVRVMGER